MSMDPIKVLILCIGNSCRSIMAKALLNELGQGRVQAWSAGSFPTGYVHPRSIETLKRHGIDPGQPYSKSWNDLPVTPDIVLSVCGNAANETCPAYLGPVLRSHWGVEDPAHVTGTDAEIDAAFMTAYRILRHRIEQFLALPLNELQNDRERLKAELDRISTLLP